LLAGAFKIPRRSFVLGNMVGMAPGLLGLGVLVNRALAALRHPTAGNVIAASAIAVASTVVTMLLKRRLLAPEPRMPADPAPAPEPRP
jgi:uncharacterized membrane protein YdjX (TVP38/TMEM64 family)